MKVIFSILIGVCIVPLLSGCSSLLTAPSQSGNTNQDKSFDQSVIRAAERSGNKGMAMHLAQQQLRLDASRWELRVLLARLWVQSGKLDEAERVLVPVQNEVRPLILRERARLALARQQPQQAQQFLERALAADPHLPEASNMLGVVYDMEGQSDKAQAQYRLSLASGDDAKARLNLGRSLLLNGHSRDALTVLEPMILRGKNPQLYAMLALAHLRLGDSAKARVYMQDWMPSEMLEKKLATRNEIDEK